MKNRFSEHALNAARSIGNYCEGRFDQKIEPMLDIPWFAEKVQRAIDDSQIPPAPAPITPEALREAGWSDVSNVPILRFAGRRVELLGWEDGDGGDLFYSNGIGPAFFVRRVANMAELMRLVAALRGEG